jgi:calcium/calmodulin-dependent protein kinase (CaM kinase) II
MSNDNSEQQHLLELTRALLKSIDEQDWETYTRLCDPGLTAFEPEANGHLVEGMPFHKFYFELPNAGRSRQSTISAPRVQLLGDNTALVTCVRLVQVADADGSVKEKAFSETRIWQRQNGTWQHIHFHRSNA